MHSNPVIEQFKGAVRTRIVSQQGWLRALLRKPMFTRAIIENVFPEENMRFFAMARSDQRYTSANNLEDLTLTELVELSAWLEANTGGPVTHAVKTQAIVEGVVKRGAVVTAA